MAVEKTLSIIKPDAIRRNLTGQINARFEEATHAIVAQKRMHLTPARPSSSTTFTTNGPSSGTCATSCRRARLSCKC